MRRLMILLLSLTFSTVACSSSEDDSSATTGTASGSSATDGADGTADSTDGTSDGTDGSSDSTDGSTEGTDGTDGSTGAPQSFCSTCKVDADCGDGRFCKDDIRGNGFCTTRCDYVGENGCDGRSYCKQFGNETNSFFCAPTAGVCEIDGLDCAPCQGAGDCVEGRSCIEPFGDITFCAKACESSSDCDYDGLACGQAEDLPGKYCLPIIAGEPTPKCGARPLDFCEQCETDGQCKSGLCLESDDIGSVCSRSCDSTDNCPSGTDCVQGACVPPLAYGCQGFLGCLGVVCEGGQLCYHGFCVSGP